MVHREPASSDISFIQADVPVAEFSGSRSSRIQGADFLRTYGSAFGIEDFSNELSLSSSHEDELGMRHLRYEQRYDGLEVLGHELLVHLDDASVTAVNGRFAGALDVDTEASVTSGGAAKVAVTTLGGRSPGRPRVEPQVLIYVDSSGESHLAWRVHTPTTKPFGLWTSLVDAHSGEQITTFSAIETAKDRDTYSGGNGFSLPGALARAEGSAAVGDADVNAAHDNSGIVYDYFLSNFGRDSYDGSGHKMRSTVNHRMNYNNAFWCNDACMTSFYGAGSDGQQMVYGDGDGITFSPLSHSLDVVGHELTHAVVDSTAGLIYEGQSGALNESYADIFGVMVDSDDWLVGEDVFTPAVPGDALRSLADPPAFGHPGHMDQYRYMVNDSRGVHYNSGIPNKAAYLTSEGNGYGIGRAKTAAINYRALTEYLTPTSTFMDNLIALETAAADLYGADGPEVNAVLKAYAAVGLAPPPTIFAPNGGEIVGGNVAGSVSWNGTKSGFQHFLDYAAMPAPATYTQDFGSGGMPADFQAVGSAPWTVTTEGATPAGSYAARSGAIGHGQTSALILNKTLSSTATVNFRASTSTQSNADYLSFWVDGVFQPSARSGANSWGDWPTVTVSPGPHTFAWVYDKNGGGSSGTDSVMVDDISITNVSDPQWQQFGSVSSGVGSVSWTPGGIGEGSGYMIRARSSGAAYWLSRDTSNGTFTIDSTGPELDPPSSSSHSPDVGTPDRTVDVQWPAAVDTVSGIDGYSYAWDASPTSDAPMSKMLEENVLAVTSPSLTNGSHYFHVRSADSVGNWSTTRHLGPFVIDNDAPDLSNVGDRSVDENSLLAFSVTGLDGNGDPLTYTAAGLPAGSDFDPDTGRFSWTPSFLQAGSYDVTFSVNDGTSTDNEQITITVRDFRMASGISLTTRHVDGRTRASGAVTPAHPGSKVIVTYFRKSGSRFIKIGNSKTPTLSSSSTYIAGFARRAGGGICKLTATFRGDFDHEASSRSKTFGC